MASDLCFITTPPLHVRGGYRTRREQGARTVSVRHVGDRPWRVASG